MDSSSTILANGDILVLLANEIIINGDFLFLDDCKVWMIALCNIVWHRSSQNSSFQGLIWSSGDVIISAAVTTRLSLQAAIFAANLQLYSTELYFSEPLTQLEIPESFLPSLLELPDLNNWRIIGIDPYGGFFDEDRDN
jgi:hypothetical protein